ncbi:phosphotransferase [Leucothrix pacifica]|uniref:Aminoglycoside phosphotransferase domain-containing protein n=1 Tax=Leucothrix pacifica TaxID=1247513 RepID=A0A317CNX8_9GAMM|nr:phosphotransferase [Leucothrix pacifica]PWQ99193.1 hypothetical protein DKW60_07130 [Leucothrix pacifica]
MQPDWQQEINQQLGGNYAWRPFAKGSSNTLYLGQPPEPQCSDSDKTNSHHDNSNHRDHDNPQAVILRLNAPTHLTPGVDRQREAALLRLIKSQNWAPNIIKNNVNDGWCAMTLYHAMTTEQPLSAPLTSQLIKAVSELQKITTKKPLSKQLTTALTVDYNVLWETTYVPQATARHDQITLDLIDEIKQNLRELPLVPTCLVHHDLHLGNLVLKPCDQHSSATQDQLIILDWEYGGLGNPWLDAAALANFFKIPARTIATLPAFHYLDPCTFEQGLVKAFDIRDLINKLWYRARGEI